jgi:N-methylhydantoinase A
VAILGVDVGGTFTDAVLLSDDAELRTAKVPTAARQEESVLAAASAVGARNVDRFAHGMTVATNALLERKGATTAFVATEGFEHLLHLRRQNRFELYRLCAAHPAPLVPLERCYGVRGRIGPDGELAPLEGFETSLPCDGFGSSLPCDGFDTSPGSGTGPPPFPESPVTLPGLCPAAPLVWICVSFAP